MSTTCPKCQYTRHPTDTAPDYECPKCGIVYQKFRAAEAIPEAWKTGGAEASDRQSRRPTQAATESRQGRSRLRLAFLIGVAAVLAVAVVIDSTSGLRAQQRRERIAREANAPAAPPASERERPIQYHQVIYSVTGSAATAFVTYTNGSGGTEQREVKVPWTMTIGAPRGTHLYVSAQNQGEHGDVTVTITANGQRFKSATSSGAYVIAATDGIL